MRSPIFSTRLTQLLGIRHPILAGGLGPRVADARYVAAAVNAGGMGFIVGAGFPGPRGFREQLALCRELTHGCGFGVNLYISRQSGGMDRLRCHVRRDSWRQSRASDAAAAAGGRQKYSTRCQP